MRSKHYPNIYRMRTNNRKLVGAITALDQFGIEAKSVTLSADSVPEIEIHNCPMNYKLHGVPCGAGNDKHGPFVRKDARINGCRVTWTEEKPNA